MNLEYRCVPPPGCGRLLWYRKDDVEQRLCPYCNTPLQRTSRYVDPSVIDDISEREGLYQTHAVSPLTDTYNTYLDTRLHHAIVDSGMALDDLDTAA